MPRRFPLGLALAGLILVSPLSLQAQVVLGARGGINLATLSSADLQDNANRVGVNIGATVRIPLTDIIDIQLGAGFSSEGSKFNDPETDLNLSLGYIDVPVLLRFNVPSESSVSAHFVVGPNLGLNATCKVSGDEGGVSVSVDCSEFDEIDPKTFDFAATGGAGVDFGLDNGLLITVDALYNLGLINVNDVSVYEAKNRAFTFLVGLSYPVG